VDTTRFCTTGLLRPHSEAGALAAADTTPPRPIHVRLADADADADADAGSCVCVLRKIRDSWT
jgi:hypothetical protein